MPSNGSTLRDRVRDERTRSQDGNSKNSGSGVVAQQEAAQKSVSQFIDGMIGEIAQALPRHMTADRMARIVLTEVRRVPLLARCTQASFAGALMTCAQLGLEPGVSGEAYLIPFYNTRKRAHEVQLIVGYQGMAKLFWQSPLARSLDAQVVYEHDEFDYAYGLEPKLVHKPRLAGDRGAVKCYYAVATMASGGYAFVIMAKADIEKIRARAQARDDGPWATDYDAMARKTCIRQLAKLLPRQAELSQAIAHDGAVRTDLTEQGIDFEPEYPDAVPGELVDDPAGQTGATEPAGDDPALAPDRLARVKKAQQWLEAAITRASSLTGKEDAAVLWAETGEKLRDGAITKGWADTLADLVKARLADLEAAPPEPAEPVAVEGVIASLDAEDPWADRIAGITSHEDAEAAIGDVRLQVKNKTMTGERGEQIITAIRAKDAG
jgi:recombination protein RecT